MVLGVDLSLAKCGLAIYDGELKAVGTVSPKRDQSRTVRRQQVLQYIKRLHKQYGFKKIVLERVNLFGGKGQKYISMDAIAALVGLTATIEDWALMAMVEVEATAVNHWKKVVLGNGRAQKADAVAFVDRKFHRTVGHDAADAVCLAVYGYKKGLEVIG